MALDIYASDQEKSEALKQWWRENARTVVAGVIMGLLILLGIRIWMGYWQSHSQEASSLYRQMLAKRAAGADIAAMAERLVQDYGNTSYGVFGAWMLAAEKQKQGRLQEAVRHLQWSLDHVRKPALQGLMRLRLARLWLARGKPEKALQLLTKADLGGFSSAYAALRGDALVELGRLSKAQASYEKALQNGELSKRRRRILQMKLANIVPSRSE